MHKYYLVILYLYNCSGIISLENTDAFSHDYINISSEALLI